jgi:hypothetical protein
VRSAEQIGRTVSEWHDYQRAQRQAILADLLAILRRSRQEHWYRWVVGGRPALSQDEYERERIMRPRAKR